MKPELVVALEFVVIYLVIWLTIHALFAMTEVVFQAFTKLEFPAQKKWLAGLQHVRMLMNVFCLTGAGATVVLVALALNPIFGLLGGALAALVVYLLSRRVRHIHG